jgi:hypothetical protein
MSFEKCPICKEYGWPSHVCKPKFVVFRDEDDLWGAINYSGDPYSVYASDEESAAVKYCESDYEMPNDLEVLVISLNEWYNLTEEVNDETDVDSLASLILSKCKKFEMESEIVRNFWAREIDK